MSVEDADDDRLLQLLLDTLPHRREEIVSGRLSLRKLQKMYSFIFCREQVIPVVTVELQSDHSHIVSLITERDVNFFPGDRLCQ